MDMVFPWQPDEESDDLFRDTICSFPSPHFYETTWTSDKKVSLAIPNKKTIVLITILIIILSKITWACLRSHSELNQNLINT